MFIIYISVKDLLQNAAFQHTEWLPQKHTISAEEQICTNINHFRSLGRSPLLDGQRTGANVLDLKAKRHKSSDISSSWNRTPT